VKTLNAVAQLIAAPGFIVSLFIWRLRFAKTPLDARGGGWLALHWLVDLLGPRARDPESMRAFSVVVQNWETPPRPPISEIIRGKPGAHRLTRPLNEKVRASLQHARSWIEKRNQKKDAIAHFARERFMKGRY
jgi:hypothetical protein